MSAPKKIEDEPVKSQTGAESPTTKAEIHMDSDNEEMGGHDALAASNTEEVAPPPKPPRPLSPQQQAENTLKEAFPSIDAAVVKAVLIASGGRVEPAFNALLGMSDPDAVTREPEAPPQPPRPPRASATPQSQVEADEQYARQLAEHYGGGGSYGHQGQMRGNSDSRYRQQGYRSNEVAEENRSFIDDDLPIIKENLRKGFLETQTRVNGWITNLKKKIDGEDEDDDQQHQYNANAPYRSRRRGDGRQSNDYSRYDADPQVLGDDFAVMQLNANGSSARRSTRPLANPDLFKPNVTSSNTSGSQNIPSQNTASETGDLYSTSPKLAAQGPTPAGKPSKWQPLSTVEPSPMGETENDPFSLGDSEDEKESKDRVGGKEIKMEDAERLKKAAAEAVAENIAPEPERKPEAAETTGTKDKVAEELTGKP